MDTYDKTQQEINSTCPISCPAAQVSNASSDSILKQSLKYYESVISENYTGESVVDIGTSWYQARSALSSTIWRSLPVISGNDRYHFGSTVPLRASIEKTF